MWWGDLQVENETLMMLSLIAGFILTLALFAYVYFRGLTLVGAYKEMGYDAASMFAWTIKKKNFEKHATLTVLISYVSYYILQAVHTGVAGAMFFALILLALTLGAFSNQKALSKKKGHLAETPKERRILVVYLILTGIYFATLFGVSGNLNFLLLTLAFLAYLQAPPIFVIAANFIVRPFMKENG